jgi:hypothetical protein
MRASVHLTLQHKGQHSTAHLLRAGSQVPVAPARRPLRVQAGVLSATGQRFQAEHVTVKGTMGEGSYGQVFEVGHAGSMHACMHW